ncbi:HAD family hydrolase [Mangrovimonas xylaniphaga]|uniref:HAD family hydrolase n=1 Tax=Mangrovimonas xylaniphaga TaxID=1645915 RepID=UPI0006B5DE04|nr:HAD family phosphatase [Mangrovimonas xylaniphaga]
MLKVVLFDMDGVIVDTEPLHHKAYHKMFDDYGIDVSDELYETFTGKSTRNVCKFLCSHFGLDEDPINLERKKRNHFNHLFDYDESLQLLDGVLELIQEYHANGLTLILASSATMSTIDRVFKRFELDQYFKAKLSGADLKASKPHPEIFLKAAEVSGHEKHQCMVIEDSTNGIVAANSAAIFCVAYRSENSKNQDYTLANLLIDDFKEISFEKIQNLQIV